MTPKGLPRDSDHDVHLRISGRGITAQTIMTQNPVTVTPHDTVEDAANIFYQHNIQHLPVVDDGRLIGILCERDIKPFLGTVPGRTTVAGTLGAQSRMPIQLIYRSDFTTLSPDAQIDQILEVLVEEKSGAIAVVQPRDFRLIGIISYLDVLKQIQALSELSELEAMTQSRTHRK